MAIQKKLLHFNDKSNFELLLERGNILNTSIVFILSTGLIWTHGLYYNSLTDEIINLLDNIPTKVSLLENDSNFLTSHLSLDSYYTKAETLELVNTKIQEVVGAAPEALDTLEEIAAKLNEDSDAITAINGVLTGKATKEEVNSKVSKTGDETIDGNKTFSKDIKIGTNKVWHLGNDGPDSGLDADTLDGILGADVITKDILPVPTSLNNGNILQVVNGLYKLANLNLGDINAYGIEWDDSVSDPRCTRIGNMNLHKTLPIQSLMKGCICLGKNIMYWLDEDNWKYKKGGNPDKGETKLLARLDGYDGTVKVYVPTFYLKSEEEGTKQRVWISTIKVDDTWEEQPACLVDAYRNTILNEVPTNMGYLSTLEVGTAISVVNTASYCRGGGNRDSYDTYLSANPCRSDLGKSRSNITRAAARTAAVKSGGHLMSYYEYKNIMCWLYFIEYANFNALEAYNSALTSAGYHQGGMGNSMTTWNYTDWSNFNDHSQITPCGYTNEFGNKTGIKNITFTDAAGIAVTMLTNRWRGLENFFGDIWTFVDGVIINADSASRTDNMDYCYLWKDPAEFGDSMKNNYILMCKSIHTDGYVKTLNLGAESHIFAKSIGGNTTQWKCDYHYAGEKNSVLRVLLVGGRVNYGGYSGPLCLYSSDSLSNSWFNVGFRVITSV